MRKIYLFIILIFSCSLFSCNQSIEDKVAKLIKNDLTTELENKKYYVPISTTIDSAYTPWDSPILLDDMDSIINQYIKVNSYTNLILNSYKVALEQVVLEQTRYESVGSILTAIKYTQKIDSIINNITITDSLWYENPQFIGYKIKHNYQIQKSVGKIEEKYIYYLTDTNLNIIRKYDSIDNTAEDMISTIRNKMPYDDLDKKDMPQLITRLCKFFILNTEGTKEILKFMNTDE